MTKKVSIVIPCYNAEKYIEKTLSSIASQTYKYIEVIIVNDGSSDNSLEKIKKFNSTLKLIVINKENTGVSDSRNIGFKNATGNYVTFLDADDVLSTKFVEQKLKIFHDNPEINCIGSIKFLFQKEFETFSTYFPVTKDWNSQILLYPPNFGTNPSCYMFTREVLEKTQLYNIKLSSTADRFFLLENQNLWNASIDDNPESALWYRIVPNSMSNVFNKNLIDDNATFYHLVSLLGTIPNQYLKKGDKILAKSYFKIKEYRLAFQYLFRYVFK